MAIVVLTVVGSTVASAQHQDAATVSIRCSQSVITSRSEIQLIVSIVNQSQHNLWIAKEYGDNKHAEDFAKITIRDESGKLLPRVYFDTVIIDGKPRTIVHRRTSGDMLQSGEKVEDSADLSKLYGLHKPGKYTITVEVGTRYIDSDQIVWNEVNSSPITIVITP